VRHERHREGEDEAPEPRVGRGARIGNHEEGEDQQRAALQLVQRDRERIAEPKGAREQERGVAGEEEDRDVGAARGVQHQDGAKGDERCEPDAGAPLAGRDPHVIGEHEQRHDGEAGRVEHVLAVAPDHEFGENRDDAGDGGERRLVGAQEQAERQPGDEGRAQVELLEPEPPGAGRLRRERRRERERARQRLGAEIDVEEIDGEEGR